MLVPEVKSEEDKEQVSVELNQYKNKKIAEDNLVKALNIKSLFVRSMGDIIKLLKRATKTTYNELSEEDKHVLDESNKLMNGLIELMNNYSEAIVKKEED